MENAVERVRRTRAYGMPNGGPAYYGPWRVTGNALAHTLWRCPDTRTWAGWRDADAIGAHCQIIARECGGDWQDAWGDVVAEDDPIAYATEEGDEMVTLAEALDAAEEVG